MSRFIRIKHCYEVKRFYELQELLVENEHAGRLSKHLIDDLWGNYKLPKLRNIDPHLVYVGTNSHDKYTSKYVCILRLGIWELDISLLDWHDVATDGLQIIAFENSSIFEKVLTQIKSNGTRKYFSEYETDLTKPARINFGDKSLFVETKLSANNVVELIRKTAEAFKYDNCEVFIDYPEEISVSETR
ncbi:hypothetical protein LNTAR_15092 [Lentisphaera araneosa HTCC2155]|uniref:Uncharacterized protein n=1 Tax=Lentisphaera araneosa HTCC2155 TaxID=313628 RepID=A6DRE3_9BACT|nr:hypothetical protein [Lentisphaera araneosa]EDM25753.1 hypothetical protein LNTAR_15092 [Lentisphaera araneosa HTCC2155]